MQKIKILPEHVANKIAAGEVVNRPESVVKELLENSIDAKASSIDVYIKGAGKVLIQVSDDGEGMSEEDALLCIQRHATSKISTAEDLTSIKTFGFRGEALSAIASVSVFELKTERKTDEIGTLIRIDEFGKIFSEKGSFSKGTTVAVKNLFYNTPARRNFLKSNSTELKHIIETFKRIALSHPHISFKLYNDDELLFDFPATTLDDRMKSVFAENILDLAFEVKELTEYISLFGYIGKPTYLRKSRGEQYFYLNNRYVVSKVINHAVFTSFENIMEKGDYPFFVLFMEIDPKKIDVNVHPSKLEVKFEDEKEIYTFVQAVVKKGIGSYDLVPSISLDDETKNSNSAQLRFIDFRKTEKYDLSDRPNFSKDKNHSAFFSDEDIDRLFGNLNNEIKYTLPNSNVLHPFDEKEQKEIYHTSSIESQKGVESPFIVLLHNKYILTQIKSGLMIIDAHVAHERILYEKALKSFNANLPFSQQLLFAQTLKADPADIELIKELNPYLVKLGFEIKISSKNTITILGVPSDVLVGTEIETLLEILKEYRKNQQEKNLEITDNIAKSFSCKAAIKAGHKLNETEMRILVDQLFATSMPYVCPHGRPIVVKIPIEEFDKRFGRT
ncbi:DNA mismatch repair endonuclease MutL [Melioribacteraceae bacterium 4301-Me]|uniref:DNA mismatch repair endonuclease MutL n=1 Tax=Pyranulibacter aquaticus TaxID=3163344 RepID=UPI003598727D